MRTRRNPSPTTPLLPLGGLHNSDLLSNHWLEHRLSLEPEWHDLRTESDAALASLTTLWQQQRSRVEHYGDEQGLEEAFIQPVLRALGWAFLTNGFTGETPCSDPNICRIVPRCRESETASPMAG